MSKIIKYVCMQEAPVVIESRMMVEEALIDTSAVDDITNQANSEVENMIAQAKMTAERYISEANQQIAILKQQAYDEAHQQGYQEGHQQGYQEGQRQGYQEGITQGKQIGLAEMQQVIDQAIEKTQQMLTTGEEEAKKMIFAAEKQIVDIALAVARKILAYEIAENPMVVLPLVRAALQKVSDQEKVVIRVNIDDFDAVLMAKKELQTMVGSEHALKIVVDSTIGGGSCVIDTSYGTVDARVDTQFETIKKALQSVA